MSRRLSLLTLLLTLTAVAFAQTGTIDGKVVDHKTNEAIIGANVVIQGTTVGSATDIDGNFVIPNVKAGSYMIVVSYIAYKGQTIPDVVVESGKKTTLSVTLVEDIAELQEVVVTARKEIASDVNLLNAIRESKLVVSGISSEQMVKLPDRDAAQVVQRVPGVTIQDGRFVLVRGMPERYNQVMINDIIGPSTEIDKRSFSFDLMPAGTIDQMLIYKSGAAELPGDFAGGVIQMITKAPTHEGFTSFSLNFGVRTATTFNDFHKNTTGATDFLGFDDGGRELPSSFPSTDPLKNSMRNSQLRETAGKSLTNSFALNQKTAVPDMGFSFATSNNFRIGALRLSNLTSVAYSNSYKHYSSSILRYNSFSSTGPDEKRFEYRDNVYSNDVRVNLMHNWTFNINDANRIEFKNLFVQLGDDKTTIREGNDFIQRPSDNFRNYAYQYLSRSIYTGQLQGNHRFGDGFSTLNWVFGLNYINRNEPDYRRFRTYRNVTAVEGDPYIMQLPPSANLFETGRFYSDLKDVGYSTGLNFERKFGDKSSKRTPTIKAGYYLERKTRSYAARYLNYLYPGFFDQVEGQRLIRLPIDEIFSPENIKRQDGFVIEEGTSLSDQYDGENTLGAGYASVLLPLGKFDLSAGLRAEYNVQKLYVGPQELVNNPIFSPLPMLNAAYNINDRSLLRVAYSRTVNRPEFRELAPFMYYQFEYETGIIGNPALQTAFINNVDLRYEFYPNPGEIVSVGTFYKQIKNPIEQFLQITSEVPQALYKNSVSGYDYGLEVEYRKSLASLGMSRFMRNTSVNLNAAWIKSRVDNGDDPLTANLARYRPMQGQSPYIVNAGVYYNDEEKGYSINVAYNVFGPRIYVVGDVLNPSWWEMPRQSLDMQASKKIGEQFEIKFNIQNLLNTPFRILQDDSWDQEIDNTEALIQRYRIGSQYSMSLGWKFAHKDN